MTLHINFELSESDLERFYKAMMRVRQNASGKTPQQITDSAQQLISQIKQSDTTDFIRDRMDQLEMLVNMATDQGWGLHGDDLERVLTALSYFCEPGDLVPDDIPGLGYIDDAIMIDIICHELEHEIQAFKEFVAFRAAEARRLGDDALNMQKAEWLDERRQQLHSRMRRRRESNGSGRSRGRRVKSPFSLLG
jgi:hypothetical protein